MSDNGDLRTRLKRFFKGKPDKGQFVVSEKIVEDTQSATSALSGPVQIISIEEINRGQRYTPAELNAIQFIANAAHFYQNSIILLVKGGTKKEWIQKIVDESQSLFPNQYQRSIALALLSEIKRGFLASGSELSDKDDQYKGLSFLTVFHDVLQTVLRDIARQDYYVAAQILKTLIPVEVWLEGFYFDNIPDNISRLFYTSDLLYRLDEIRDIKDIKILCEIALTDKNPWCRIIAIEKIDDEIILTDIAKTDPESRVRRSTLRKIKKQAVLKDLASTEQDEVLGETAVRMINDQSLLINLVETAAKLNVRRAALKKIEDETRLLEIAQANNEESIWGDAISKINDMKNIKLFIATCVNAEKRAYTVKRIHNDESCLIEIAKNDLDGCVRATAVNGITNQLELTYIARNDTNARVRAAAVNGIVDEVELSQIAKTDNDVNVRKVAIKKITNQEMLAEIARMEKDGLIRTLIVNKITEDILLTDIVICLPDNQIALIAVDKISDQANLTRIAIESRSSTIRRIAVSKINDQYLLADIAQTTEDKQVCLEALNKITDDDILSNFKLQ